ncbi:MAG: hypothetical protein ABF802_06805 [Acetobacter orientalis]|uniref:hypothetical protein n=1 Tax=Acetobacter orientalis TaxID=146474 RepID=UPI0039E76B51
MNFISKLGGLVSSLLASPAEIITDFAKEPIRRWEHNRNEASKDSEHERMMRHETVNALREKENKEFAVELRIKEETGVAKALAEIEDLKKDREMERMEKTTESIKKYLEELTRLKIESVKAIGNMHLDLREKAQDLVIRKTMQYKALQDDAINSAIKEFELIDEKFSNNDAAKSVLIRSVDLKMSNIMNAAQKFLDELNRDIVNLNNDISELTKHGQSFIEGHLNRISIGGSNINDRGSDNILISNKKLLN